MEQGTNANSEKMELFKSQVTSYLFCKFYFLTRWLQAKQLLKKMNPRSTAKMSIESNPYVFQ